MTLQTGKELLYLTQNDVVGLKLDNDIMDLVENALTEHGLKKYEMPIEAALN